MRSFRRAKSERLGRTTSAHLFLDQVGIQTPACGPLRRSLGTLLINGPHPARTWAACQQHTRILVTPGPCSPLMAYTERDLAGRLSGSCRTPHLRRVQNLLSSHPSDRFCWALGAAGTLHQRCPWLHHARSGGSDCRMARDQLVAKSEYTGARHAPGRSSEQCRR